MKLLAAFVIAASLLQSCSTNPIAEPTIQAIAPLVALAGAAAFSGALGQGFNRGGAYGSPYGGGVYGSPYGGGVYGSPYGGGVYGSPYGGGVYGSPYGGGVYGSPYGGGAYGSPYGGGAYGGVPYYG